MLLLLYLGIRLLLEIVQLFVNHCLILGLHCFAIVLRYTKFNLDQLVEVVVDSPGNLVDLLPVVVQ